MERWQQVRRRTLVLGLAWVSLTWGSLVWTTGCSRQIAVPGSAKAGSAETGSAKTGGSGQLPFDRVSDGRGISPTAAFDPSSLPVGTEITVQLRSPLSSADSRTEDTFDAALAEPIIAAGQTVMPQGTSVIGKVVAAKAGGGRRDPGYLRLTLASIALNGKSIPLQTSSVFAKGETHRKRSQPVTTDGSEPGNAAAGTDVDSSTDSGPSRDLNRGDVRFSTGRRFTFHVAQPLHLPN